MSQAKRILILDPIKNVGFALEEQLRLDPGWNVEREQDVQRAVSRQGETAVDFVVVNLEEGGCRRQEIGKCFRSSCYTGPFLFLVNKMSLDADCGEDDILCKPFRFSALLAHIRFCLAQKIPVEIVTRIGKYTFHPTQKLLRDCDGSEQKLTEKETEILNFLLQAEGQSVPRETLLREIWGYNEGVSTHTVETHIYRLRRKMEDNLVLITDEGGYTLRP